MGIAQVSYSLVVIDFNGEMKALYVPFEPTLWKEMKEVLKTFYIFEFLPRIIFDIQNPIPYWDSDDED